MFYKKRSAEMKKVVALLLAMIMLVSVSQAAFAIEEVDVKEITMEQIQAEIDEEVAKLYESIYFQLEAQDALCMLDGYMNILEPEIERHILAKYNVPMPQANYTRQWYFPEGGMVTFRDPGTGTVYARTYYDYDDSYYFYSHKDAPNNALGMAAIILGFVPTYGTAISTVLGLTTLKSSIRQDEIDEAHGYICIFNAKNSETGIGSSVIHGWLEYPFAELTHADYYEDVQAEFYPENDPWEGGLP